MAGGCCPIAVPSACLCESEMWSLITRTASILMRAILFHLFPVLLLNSLKFHSVFTNRVEGQRRHVFLCRRKRLCTRKAQSMVSDDAFQRMWSQRRCFCFCSWNNLMIHLFSPLFSWKHELPVCSAASGFLQEGSCECSLVKSRLAGRREEVDHGSLECSDAAWCLNTRSCVVFVLLWLTFSKSTVWNA